MIATCRVIYGKDTSYVAATDCGTTAFVSTDSWCDKPRPERSPPEAIPDDKTELHEEVADVPTVRRKARFPRSPRRSRRTNPTELARPPPKQRASLTWGSSRGVVGPLLNDGWSQFFNDQQQESSMFAIASNLDENRLHDMAGQVGGPGMAIEMFATEEDAVKYATELIRKHDGAFVDGIEDVLAWWKGSLGVSEYFDIITTIKRLP